MNFSKIIVLCGICTAMSYAGISIHIDGKKKHKDGWGLDLRECDGSTCCDFHLNEKSEYKLKCNEHPKEVSVHVRNGSERVDEGNGRLRYTVEKGERVDLRVRAVPRIYKERMCDNGICCEFEQDLRSRDYKFHCDRPYDRAELKVKAGGHRDHFDLSSHGRLPIEIRPGDRCELRMTPPPPPPPPPEKKKKKKGVDIHIRL